MTELLTLRDLQIRFDAPEGTIEAVRGVSFGIRAGSTLALVGESGSGKSVISQAILGILPRNGRIAAGQILFRDPDRPGTIIDLARLRPTGREMRDIRGGRISIIFQEPMTSLSPLHTVGDQIGEAVQLHRNLSTSAARDLTIDMLRLVEFPEPARAVDRYPFELSGGLRQRAMIAMALICRPALLVADEPTTALDVTIQAQILKLIIDLQAELGMAVLMITHDLGVVANIAKDVVVMYRGEVMEAGVIDDIFGDPRHPYLRSLLRAVPRFDMEPGERLVPIREIKVPDSSRLMSAVPGRAPDRAVASPAEDRRPLLRVDGIRKSFMPRASGLFGLGGNNAPRVMAVEDVSFDVRRGECLGLVGESGCGKTTLSKVLMRALTPDAGSVVFDDGTGPLDVLALTGDDLVAFRRKLQFVFQDPFGSLNPRMTVFEIIVEPLVIHGIGSQAEREETVKELVSLVGLDVRHLRRYPHSFSGGQRQRIGIARALALRPDLLICDEPVSALDVSIQAQILNLLKDLQQKLGLTYLFISHNLAVVNYIADRIMVMCRGRIVELADRERLFRNPQHPYTRALLSAVPEPNPHCRLDLEALRDGRASDPSAWPAPFTIGPQADPHLIPVADGHFVRASHVPALLEVA